MGALVKYEAACQALAVAKTVDEAKDIHDKAEAMRAYARQAKNKVLEVDAAEIRMRAERRLGELIKAQKETVGLNKGAQGLGTADKVQSQRGTAPPTLAEAGIDKKLSSRAQKLAAVPEDRFEDMVGDWRGRVEQETERVTVSLLREGERAQRDEELARREVAWPEGKHAVIYADPPWRYEHPPMGGNRVVENHYPTMSLDEICALPVADITADDAVLFMWATSPKLAECFAVLDAWGFTYRTCMVWTKDKIGMGYYARQRHEILLIARRGEMSPPEPANRPDSVVSAPRLEHSAKPEVFYDLIERMYPDAPKVELFARQQRPGWAAFGNQAAPSEVAA
jgi:N6-adenosine-specific RNA methylase IME4